MVLFWVWGSSPWQVVRTLYNCKGPKNHVGIITYSQEKEDFAAKFLLLASAIQVYSFSSSSGSASLPLPLLVSVLFVLNNRLLCNRGMGFLLFTLASCKKRCEKFWQKFRKKISKLTLHAFEQGFLVGTKNLCSIVLVNVVRWYSNFILPWSTDKRYNGCVSTDETWIIPLLDYRLFQFFSICSVGITQVNL